MPRRKIGRTPVAYARRGPIREPYDYVLVVCEGEKTEPNYLQGLKIAYRLSNANIIIIHPDATDPMSIVTYAETELDREGYDCAYCVFDRDGHPNYDAALRRVTLSRHNGRLRLAVSVPCFEVWLILHFCFTSRPFTAIGGLSAGDRVVRELREHLPEYTKGQSNTFELLASRLESAIKHANMLEAENRKSGADNPATDVHRLVEYLMGLRKVKKA
jgi:hypothetical protein